MPATRASPDCRTPTCGSAMPNAMLERVRDCWASLYSVESISYRRDRGIAEAVVAMAVVVQSHGGRARRRGDVHAQSDHRRPFGDHHRRRLGPGLRGGRRRSHAGSLGGRQDHRRDQRARHLRQAHRASPRAGRWRRARRRSRTERRRAAVPQRCGARAAAPGRAPASSGTTAARRTSSGRSTRSGALLLLQSRPETVWSAKEAAPAARAAADPLAHVMSIFGGRR